MRQSGNPETESVSPKRRLVVRAVSPHGSEGCMLERAEVGSRKSEDGSEFGEMTF